MAVCFGQRKNIITFIKREYQFSKVTCGIQTETRGSLVTAGRERQGNLRQFVSCLVPGF